MTIRNSIPIIALAIISFTACKKRNNANEKLIENHFKFMNLHNVSALKGQYADTALLSSYVMPGYKRGPLGADELYHFMFFQSPNERYKVAKVIENDSTAIVEYDVEGFRSFSIVQSGYVFRNCTIFKINSGKIVNEATYTGKPAITVAR